jgi:NAD-specific glutamate dehydrogenase
MISPSKSEPIRFEPELVAELAGEVDEFVTAVRNMRAAQKRYFAERDRLVLREAKRLEKLVDRYVRTWDEVWTDSASP